MASKKAVETTVKFKVDKTSVSETVKASQQVKQAVASVGGDFQGAAQSAKTSAAAISSAMRNDVSAAVKSASAEVDNLNTKLDAVGSKKNVLSTVGREIRALPAMPIPGTGISTDVVGKFMDTLGKVPPVMKLAEGATAALTPVLGASAAGFVGIGVALATVAAPLIAAGLAIKSFTDLVAAQAAAMEAAKAQLQGDTQQRMDNALAIKNASAESIRAQLEDQKTKLEIIKQDKAAREEQLRIVQKQYEELGATFDPAQRAALGQAGQVWQAEIERLTEEEKSLAASIENTTTKVLPAVQAREREQAAIERTTAALTKIEALEAQRANVMQQAAIQTAQINQDRALRESREQEDFNRAREQTWAKHFENLHKIDEQGQARLADIRERGNDQLANIDKQINRTNDSIVKVAQRLNKDRNKVEEDAADSRAKAYAKAQKDEIKALADFNKRKRDIERDYANASLDAEAANDVVAAIQAERARDEALRSNQEQYDENKAARAEALADELAEIETRKAARLADLEAAAQERRADLLAQLEEQRAQRAALALEIAAQMEAEKAAIEERKNAAINAINEQINSEDAARKLRLQRQAEDDRNADQRRQFAMQQQMADIARKIAEETRAAGLVASAWVNAAIAAAAQSRNALLGQTTSSSAYASGGGAASRVAFAGGGVITRPTIALMGERPGYNEMVVPFRKSDGLPSGFGQQVVVNFTPSITVGDVATMRQVYSAVESAGNELAMQIVRGLGAARMAA